MEYTSSPKPQLSSRANAFSIAALMSSGKPNKDKEAEENTIKPLGKRRIEELNQKTFELLRIAVKHPIIKASLSTNGVCNLKNVEP